MKHRISIPGSPLLGVFATCTEDIVFVPVDTPGDKLHDLEESLGVTGIPISVGGSSLVGSLMRGNSKGVVAAGLIHDSELDLIKKHTRAVRLEEELNAAGNIIIANDTAALVHPELSDRSIDLIKDTLGIKVKRGTIGGLKTVGMAGVATNLGVLVHPKATSTEVRVLEELFDLPVDIGTVNFGSPLVGSGLLANSKGYITGEETTGPEIGRIEDALGYL